ncbi:MAG: putative lipid II flippase FtsW [Nakamurella sp.]
MTQTTPATTTARSRSLAGADDSAPGLPARVRRGIKSVRRLMADWLDRPMTSLHLIMAIFALMLGFGLLMVLSSSSVAAFRSGGSSFSVFANQATYAAVGLVLFCAAQFLPVRLMRSLSTIAVIVALALLVAVLIPGVGALVNGARSWIRLGGLQFQPSEIAKLALLLWMAHVLAARRSTLGSPKALLIPVLPVFGLMAGLIMFQPDLGTTVALTIVFMAVLFFAGAPRWMFASLGALGMVAFFYLAVSADYRLARLLSFINPEEHPEVSYQLLQSLYGMGNGGWFGVGLGQSRAKWSYLPNADSDFIFAIIGEELGLIGAGILLFLFALLAYTGLRIARRNVDPFVKIVASAATVWLVGQAAINIGYVVGLLPVTGIPLPMISAGGTSLLITMVVFGLLANFARREPQAAAALAAGGGGRLARFLGIRRADGSGVKSASRRRRKAAAAGAAVTAAAGPRRGSRPSGSGPDRTPGARQDTSRGARTATGQSRTNSPRTPGTRRPDPRGSDLRAPNQRNSSQQVGDPRGQQRGVDQRGVDQRGVDQRGVDPRGAAQRGVGQRGAAQPGVGQRSADPRDRPGRRGGG